MADGRIPALIPLAALAAVLLAPSMPCAAQTYNLPVPIADRAGELLPSGILAAERAARGSDGQRGGGTRSFTMETVAEIYPELYQQIAFGDTDHDGWNEAFLYVNDNGTFHYRILEEHGNNVYSDEYSGPGLIPYATGDLDGDGKAELIGQVGYKVYVYESSDAASYPTQLVWSSPNISNVVGYTAIGDTDRDGRQEIIHSLNPFSGNSELFIFENTGNNAFSQAYRTVVGPGANGEKVIADLDGDGLTEIAFSGLDGHVYVYESSADNVWVRTWSAGTSLMNAYGAEGGRDTDGDGKPELFIFGNGPGGWTTIVFEAAGDNLFAPHALFALDDGYIGLSCNAAGNLDNIGPDEYLMQGDAHFWLFAPSAPGQWDLLETVNDPLGDLHFGLQTYDANKNGRDEVFWDIETNIQYGWHALVMEHPLAPETVAEQAMPGGETVRLYPNPFRFEAHLYIPPAARPPLRLSVFDPAGRLLENGPLPSAGGVPLVWRPGPLGPGLYILAIREETGRVVGTVRGTIVR